MNVQGLVNKVLDVARDLYRSAPPAEITREPDVDIYEQDGMLLIYMDMPGFRKENIRVKVYDSEIEVVALPSMDQPGNVIRAERISNFRVARRIGLGVRIRPDTARAVYRDGVLVLMASKLSSVGEAEPPVE